MTPDLKATVERLRNQAVNGRVDSMCFPQDKADILAVCDALEAAEKRLHWFDSDPPQDQGDVQEAVIRKLNLVAAESVEADRRKRDAEALRWAAKSFQDVSDSKAQLGEGGAMYARLANNMVVVAERVERGEIEVKHE